LRILLINPTLPTDKLQEFRFWQKEKVTLLSKSLQRVFYTLPVTKIEH
jgi:hypothetical protein